MHQSSAVSRCVVVFFMNRRGISLIAAAASETLVIGRNGQLPWPNIALDRHYFLDKIAGGVIIMGRRSYEESLTGALPGVTSIVLSTSPGKVYDDALTATSLGAALELAAKICTPGNCETWVVGGEGVYQEALPIASKLYLTTVHAPSEVVGDTRFPSEWQTHFPQLVSSFDDVDEPTGCALTFEVWLKEELSNADESASR
jgi:dihydrofolate reductase